MKGWGRLYNNLLKSIFDGYTEAKHSNKKKYPEKNNGMFDWLVHENNSILFSVAELDQLQEEARTDYQLDCILEHLNRHDAWEVPAYKKIERKIIEKRRSDQW